MSFKISAELRDAVSQITCIMEQSERVTKATLDSLKLVDTNILNAKQKMDHFFSFMDEKQFKLNNLERSIKSLDNLSKFFDTIDEDQKYIQNGPQGSLEEYIKRLENLKSFHKYNLSDNKSYATSSYLFTARMRQLKVLLIEGERILMDEFKNIIKHYSSQETIISFINYLINVTDFHSVNLNQNDQQNFLLFIPKETLQKLQVICTWFLIKEQNGEFYDERNEYWDIIEKLKYIDVRFEFIKLIIKYYLRLSSQAESSSLSLAALTVTPITSQTSGQFLQPNMFNSQSSKSSSMSMINKFLHLNHNISDNNGGQSADVGKRSPNIRHKSKYGDSDKLNDGDPRQVDSPRISSNNLQLLVDESNKLLLNKMKSSSSTSKSHKSRSLECIESFSDSLNFCLKVLQHEKLIVNYIFRNSEETCNELLTKLAVLVIEEIQNELILFSNQNIDFIKPANNGPYVVKSIIQLVLKVDMLKQNTHGLELNNIESASRLFQFSSSLNMITAKILFFYLDAIKSGYFNIYQFPSDCSIHEFCVNTCEIMRTIKTNEGVLDNAIHILCENFIDKASTEEKYDPSEPFKGRYRLKSDAFIDHQNAETERRLEYAKYFWLIIKRLNSFLIEEANKSSTISTSAITNISSTKNGIIHLKAYVFLLNNLEYILDCAAELNLFDLFRLINKNFDNFIDESIQKNCEKACEIFQDINAKWKAIVKQTESNAAMLGIINICDKVSSISNSSDKQSDRHSSSTSDGRKNSLSEKRNSSYDVASQLPSLFQSEVNEQQIYLNNLSKISSASNVAKKAFKSFKTVVLRPKNSSEDVMGSDNDDKDLNDLNLVRVTKLGQNSSSISQSHQSSVSSDMTLLNVTRNVSELRKRRLTLIQQLTTAIELSTKLVVINPSSNARIKEIVRSNLNQVIDSLEVTEISNIIRKVFANQNLSDKTRSFKDQIFDEMFPNYKL